MPDTYRATRGLTLANGQRIEAGETTTAPVPAWVIEQGHVELVASAPTPPPPTPITPAPIEQAPAPVEPTTETEATP